MAKTMMILKSIFICYAAALVFTNGSSIDGFTTDLIHRDSPQSPFYDPSLTPSQRLANAAERIISSRRRFNETMVRSPDSTITAGNGEYQIRLFIGTPLEHIVATISTASSMIWTQCQPCERCFHQLWPIFNPKTSYTYKDVGCHTNGCDALSPNSYCNEDRGKCLYSVYYNLEGSTSHGVVGTETFIFSDTKGRVAFPRVTFGCGNKNAGQFDGTASGVVGLGDGKGSLVTQLGYDKFSYCFMPLTERKKSSKLHFGANAVVSGRGVVRTPLAYRTLYLLELQAVTVGNERMQFLGLPMLAGGNIVIEAGATETSFPPNFYLKFLEALKSNIHLKSVFVRGWRLCYESPGDIVIPKIILHFKDADVEWKHYNVFFRVSDDHVCLAVAPTLVRPLYGSLAQINFLVGFDLAKNTVSFKPTNCGSY